MTIAQGIIVYFVCWWLLLFMALPVGVRPQETPVPGSDAGAPQKTYLTAKVTVVSVLAAVATWGIAMLIHSGIVAVK